ncbi:MAG TPA: MerR family transcriptional regulator [Thermomicrobiales bacterium]|nr:MerR family transcriptional regulator [Thermomicrobiales bacterium]
MQRQGMKIGELAKRTGVSVRTLHHDEAVGLLTPDGRTESGYRLYGNSGVVRLQQIRSLRQVGFGLEQIGELLDRRGLTPLRVIELHLEQVPRQIEGQRRLSARLEGVAARLRTATEVSVEDVLATIEEMTRMERYYTPEQLAEIRGRGRQLGEESLRQAEADWQQLIDEVRAEMARGTDPATERVRALAARWQTLVHAFTGGNPEIDRSLQRMWAQEENIHGYDTAEMRRLGEYIAAAASAT